MRNTLDLKRFDDAEVTVARACKIFYNPLEIFASERGSCGEPEGGGRRN